MCSNYQNAKKAALKIGKEQYCEDFVESMALIIEKSNDISGGRSSELMEMIVHLLNCKRVCFEHRLMREVMGLL